MDAFQRHVLHGKPRIPRQVIDALRRICPDVLHAEPLDARDDAFARRIFFPLVVDIRPHCGHGRDAPAHGDVGNGDVLYESAFSVARLDARQLLGESAVDNAVVKRDVADAARDLAAYGEQRKPALDDAVANLHVFARNAHASAVAIPS